MAALSNTPASRSNSALRPPNNSRALAFATGCSTVYGGSAVASESRPTLSIQASSFALLLRETSDEAELFASSVGRDGGRGLPIQGSSTSGIQLGTAIYYQGNCKVQHALGDGVPSGERRPADQHGTADRKGRQAVAGRCGKWKTNERIRRPTGGG